MAVAVSPVTPAEYDTAARLVCGAAPTFGLEQRVGRFLAAVRGGEVDPAGVLLAKRNGEPVAVAVVQFLPGGTATLLPPTPHPEAEAGDALAAEIVAQLRTRNTSFACLFLDPDDPAPAAPLVRHGFRPVTRLTHLLRAGGHLPLPPEPPADIRFEPAQDLNEFGETLLATYEGTLDVPEVCGHRPAADVLAGNRANQPDPPLWWLARDPAGRPVGVVLLTHVGTPGVLELGYLGVVPVARGRGAGVALLQHAVRSAAEIGVNDLSLSVDERNEPALRLYHRHGFRPYQWQRVYLWRPGW
ncbi:MAG: GNAT family N-acetyltransferase [Gemmataceae bacterium]